MNTIFKKYDLKGYAITFLYILVAFSISIALRFIWIVWAGDVEQFLFNGQIMINTNDGYAFAEGTRDMIAGFHQDNDLSYYGYSLPTLTVFICKIFPFIKFETIILYMSGFFASLIVIPIILIAKELKIELAGFIGAVVASVANSYYNRTMFGYYDTDMLNITIPVFILLFMIKTLRRDNLLNPFILGLFFIFYRWWYLSSFSLCLALLCFFVIYTLIFQIKRLLNYQAISIALVSICWLDVKIQIVTIFLLVLFFYFCMKKYQNSNIKICKFITITGLFFALAIFIIYGGLNPILSQLKFYFFRDLAQQSSAYSFVNVSKTIHETEPINYDRLFIRISSSEIIFILSFLGLFFAIFKYKELILCIPMALLGLTAYKMGLRFTIYAVPIFAIGFGYLSVVVINLLVKFLKLKTKFTCNLSIFTFTLSALILALYPSIKHIYLYKMPTVFLKNEVEALERLKNISSREDYVLAWWDYGYPIRYYSDVKTLIDGGKHLGSDNYSVAFALSKPQIASANMARADVEYTERFFKSHKNKFDEITKDYGLKNFNEFLEKIEDENFDLNITKTRDIYYFLPNRMFDIFETINMFSNIDVLTGKSFDKPFFYSSQSFISVPDEGVVLDGGLVSISPDMSTVTINHNGNKVKSLLNTFLITKYDDNGKLVVQSGAYNPNGKIYVIFMVDYKRFLLLDKEMFDSTFVQLFVLERYNSKLFEPVIMLPTVKIYRLKK